ncbi:hypothetical protein MNBD_GAMMA12-820 [hydrothermal vent metagenome]|uniref:Nucleotide exchange factor GrpE n=1 Tax=hydrothermal vent metagenome TaxID=652676 RepID=A0A3B0YI38_9ZZZZ
MLISMTCVTHKNFIINLRVLLCLLLSCVIYSTESAPGFLESLDLAPDVIVETGSSNDQKTITKPTANILSVENPNSIVQKTTDLPLKQSATSANTIKRNSSKLTLTSNAMELPEMWHYVLLTLIALVFMAILMVLLRIYKNTREVESADNIVHQIKNLSNDIEEQNRSVRDVKLRIQKTENSFLKVLAHHIDDKNEQLLKDVDMQLHDFAAIHKSSGQQYSMISSRIGDIENLLGSLKEFVAEQKQEIRRMQDGYDWSVVNGLCLGIIEVLDNLDEEINSSNKDTEISYLSDARGLLLTMLESHNVAELKPDSEKDYSQLESDENLEITFCDSDDNDEQGKISKILQSSFVYEGAQGDNRTIRRAKIEVYR